MLHLFVCVAFVWRKFGQYRYCEIGEIMTQLVRAVNVPRLNTIQIRREVMTPWPIVEKAEALGMTVADSTNLHVTLIWSRTEVDWSLPAFEPRNDFVVIPPQAAEVKRFGDGSFVVLKIDCPEIEARHNELRAAGASWDYPQYNPHITLGGFDGSELPDRVALGDGLLLGPERRLST
jgi:uncharacterized protein